MFLAGVFIGAYNCIERAKIEGLVDVNESVKILKTQRPALVPYLVGILLFHIFCSFLCSVFENQLLEIIVISDAFCKRTISISFSWKVILEYIYDIP